MVSILKIICLEAAAMWPLAISLLLELVVIIVQYNFQPL